MEGLDPLPHRRGVRKHNGNNMGSSDPKASLRSFCYSFCPTFERCDLPLTSHQTVNELIDSLDILSLSCMSGTRPYCTFICPGNSLR